MRQVFCFVAICAVMFVWQPPAVMADHDMTCHPPPPPPPSGGGKGGNVEFEWKVEEGESIGPGEGINLIQAGTGGAMSSSCGDAGGGSFPILLFADTDAAIEHVPATTNGEQASIWFLDMPGQAFIDDHIGLSAELPNFVKPDGSPLLAQYNETDLDFVLQAARDFSKGEILSVSGGVSSLWPAVKLLDTPGTYAANDLFPPDPSLFPAYTGDAVVADIATISFVPEPSTTVLVMMCLTAAVTRRRACVGGQESRRT